MTFHFRFLFFHKLCTQRRLTLSYGMVSELLNVEACTWRSTSRDKPGGDTVYKRVRMGKTAADQLRQVIVPRLIQVVGDVKSQRLSVDAVLAYLQRQLLPFDDQLLRAMFAEADFKHKGSLAVGPLTGALQGRYFHDFQDLRKLGCLVRSD